MFKFLIGHLDNINPELLSNIIVEISYSPYMSSFKKIICIWPGVLIILFRWRECPDYRMVYKTFSNANYFFK